MPAGNLAAVVPSGVLPRSLSTAFAETRQYPLLMNTYHDGSSERALITDGRNPPVSVRRWRLSKRLSNVPNLIVNGVSVPVPNIQELLDFYEAHSGAYDAFYFYAPDEVLPGHGIGSNWDANGLSVYGRHTVIFQMPAWSHTVELARAITQIELQEVA